MTTMMLTKAAFQAGRPASRLANRSMAIYAPTLTERRAGEAGPGGRQSEAGLRVAVFGANGFLGRHVCHELGE